MTNRIYYMDKRKKYPRNGQIMNILPVFDGFKDIEIIYTFKNGKLHGNPAILATTGYSETWENGKYLSSHASICVPEDS